MLYEFHKSSRVREVSKNSPKKKTKTQVSVSAEVIAFVFTQFWRRVSQTSTTNTITHNIFYYTQVYSTLIKKKIICE